MILSLDTATHHCGYALWLDNKPIEIGEISTESKVATERLRYVYGAILRLIDTHKIDVIIFEDTNTLLNVQTLKQLCQLQGVIISLCISHNISYYSYLPSQWRKILNFKIGQRVNRQICKELAMEYVMFQYGITTRNDNIAEAICVGNAFIKTMGDKNEKH